MKITAKKEYSISDLISKSGIFSDGDWIESKDQDPNGEVRLIQLADIGDGVFIDKSKRFLTLKRAQELKCTFLKKGDILIARMPDPIGRACIFPGSEQPCVTAVDVGIIRPENNAVHNEWLKYKINSPHFRHLIREYTTGTTRKRISRKNLDKITFELPSYADQIKIVQILSKAEQLIVDRKATINLLDELVKAQFYKMFGDPLNNSMDWPLKPIHKLGKVTTGQTPPSSKEGMFGGNIPFITPGDLETNKQVKRFVTEVGAKYSRVVKEDATFVCCIGATIGKIGRSHQISAFNQQLNAVEWNKTTNPLYAEILFKLIKPIIISKGGKSTTLPILNKTDFQNILIVDTDKSLQNHYAKFLEQIYSVNDSIKESLQNISNLFNLTSQLAFEGKLDLSSINAEQQELKHIKTATDFFTQQTKLLDRLAPLTKLQQTLDKITKSTQVFKSFEAVNKAFEVNKLPHIESLKRFEEFMVNSGIGRLDEINSYQEYLDVMNQPVFKQLDIADKFKIKGLEHFYERFRKEQEEFKKEQKKKEAKLYHGQELNETTLKTILEKEFKGPFKAEILYEHLKQISLDFTYDQFVKMLFDFLKGKQPFLKQKYFETHIHEMAIPIMDLLPKLQEAQKRDGLYLMLNKE